MDNWTKTARESLREKEMRYRIAGYWVYKYGARDYLKKFNTVKELYEWLEKEDVSVNKYKYARYRVLESGGYSYSCDIRLDPDAFGGCAKKRYIRDLLSENEALYRIERIIKEPSRTRSRKWIATIPEWLYDKIAYGKKIYVCGDKHDSDRLCFKWRGDAFPVESNLTDKILDKILEAASVADK